MDQNILKLKKESRDAIILITDEFLTMYDGIKSLFPKIRQYKGTQSTSPKIEQKYKSQCQNLETLKTDLAQFNMMNEGQMNEVLEVSSEILMNAEKVIIDIYKLVQQINIVENKN